ncbi:MAG: OmpA family protein [Prevotella sp.]|nr:OmpA family protein [Prevotella sp.]
MKKLVLFFAAAVMAVSASAQTVEGSKFTDNWYAGVQGGLMTKTTQNRWLSNTNPFAGVRIGKDLTPVFGLVAEGNAYFNDRTQWGRDRAVRSKTAIKHSNVNLLGKLNLSNLFGGYKGEPRAFEVSALYGFGWLHGFGYPGYMRDEDNNINRLTSKAALNFAFNIGAAKAIQAFIEPSINFTELNQVKYNIDNSIVQVTAGLIYKFNNSWGTHNFKLATGRDQAEIDALNAQINELRNRKPEVIEKVVEKVIEAPAKEVKVEDLVFVTFAQGKYNLTAEAKKALDGVKKGSHVQIVGTASPEGNAKANQILSQNRADAVASYLKDRGVIVDKAEGKGVQGVTSNRLAIVYVK